MITSKQNYLDGPGWHSNWHPNMALFQPHEIIRIFEAYLKKTTELQFSSSYIYFFEVTKGGEERINITKSSVYRPEERIYVPSLLMLLMDGYSFKELETLYEYFMTRLEEEYRSYSLELQTTTVFKKWFSFADKETREKQERKKELQLAIKNLPKEYEEIMKQISLLKTYSTATIKITDEQVSVLIPVKFKTESVP